MQIKSLAEAETSACGPATNRVTARITAVEFTGYVTRVSLVLERSGMEVLYKARTPDWLTTPFTEGQVVVLDWATADCVFLPH
jgi:putative spermidine/putrescine transport system ATP-binding protein